MLSSNSFVLCTISMIKSAGPSSSDATDKEQADGLSNCGVTAQQHLSMASQGQLCNWGRNFPTYNDVPLCANSSLLRIVLFTFICVPTLLPVDHRCHICFSVSFLLLNSLSVAEFYKDYALSALTLRLTA